MHRNVADPVQRVLTTWRNRLLPVIHTCRIPARVTAHTLADEPVPFAEAVAGAFTEFLPGTWWGKPWDTTWLRIEAVAPERRVGHRRELLVDLGFSDGGPGFQSEGLAWDTNGRPLKGVEPRTAHLPFPDELDAGEVWTVYVEAAANARVQNRWQTLRGDRCTAPDELLYQFKHADSALLDVGVWSLALDFQMLVELQAELPEGSPRKHQIIAGLNRACDALGAREVSLAATAAREVLRPLLEAPAEASAHHIFGVGHAHIDSAWLWPVRETRRKCARTFSNVLRLAEEYPEFRFACSSAQQFAWVKEDHPELYADLRSAVARGQFIPVGGMWVESDTNMPGSEGFVRQFTQGQRFFEREFGITCHEVWLPDSFGYSAALPQIARLAQLRWMLSQKMSWNQTNHFPHSTFWWEGIDGSRIFTHFPPSDTYSASLLGSELAKSYRQFEERGHANSSLMPFGYGDGGGGPVREMVELARRTADLEGSPKFQITSPAEYFQQAEAEYPEAPVWTGEMYLEFHRGTYTTQIAMKQGNRAMEHALTEAEHWAAQAALAGLRDYPYDEFDILWQQTCLLQFHDILPGSSIAWVHREAREQFADLLARTEEITRSSLRALMGEGDRAICVNPAPVTQRDVPAFASGAPAEAGLVMALQDEDGIVLDNGMIRVRIDQQGLVTSAVDALTARESLSGPSNLLQLHPDLPNRFEAWDLDEFYRNCVEDLTEAQGVELDVSDPAAPTVRVGRRFHSSTVVQSMTLRHGSRRLDCTTELDWQEREHVLKVAFPTTVHTSSVTCEIQFGHIERPVHHNTSWDAAKFEICAHRFVQVAEPGFGVALVNRGIYGHDVTRPEHGDSRGPLPTTMRLTLARGPVYPDAFADQGRHRFEYALAVGASVETAIVEGWAMAMPVRNMTGEREIPALVTASGSVMVTAVKLADDRSGDLVVRCYEASGRRGRAWLELGCDYTSAAVVNLLERGDGETESLTTLDVRDRRAEFSVDPFQIVTLRFTPKSA